MAKKKAKLTGGVGAEPWATIASAVRSGWGQTARLVVVLMVRGGLTIAGLFAAGNTSAAAAFIEFLKGEM